MPRPETVDKAIAEIGKSAANYRYFFEKLNSPAWLAPLAEKGRFRTPPAKVEVDGGVMFPGWPESQYLARMARIPEAQDQVLQIARTIPTTDNIRVHADLLDVALALPPAHAAQLVNLACTWVQSRFDSMVNYKVGDLIAHLASGGQAPSALRFAKAAFALEPAPPADAAQEWAPSPEPRAHLRDWNYEEGLKKAIPALLAADRERTFALLCDLLDRAMALSRRKGEPEKQDYSYIWHNAIEQDEQPPRLRSTIISAVRNAAETIVSGDDGALQMVLAELRRHEWPVFKRMELHVLERFASIAMTEIIPLAVQLAAVEGGTHHEAARLLKTAFGQLPAATQQEVLRWIDAGPKEEDVLRWLQFIGREPTPETIVQFGTGWRAQRFALIADQVPEAWKERVAAVLADAGQTRKLDQVEDDGTWVGPTSPKSVDDLQQMGPAAVVEFLRTWAAPRGTFVDTPEGLGRVLGDAIARNPAGYVAQARAFQGLDPTFVRFFFSGLETALKEHRTLEWAPVLSLAQWVLAQPREIPGRKSDLMEADESWQWTRGGIASLLEDGLNQREPQPGQPVQSPIPFNERERVWSILEPITHDPDPTPEHEVQFGGDNMDPPTLAINSVRGKAMNALIAYAVWIRQTLDRLPERPATTLAVMPEVQQALEEHLDVERDQSLAIRSTYGRYLPWLHYIDPIWTRNSIPRIFPAEEPLAAYRAAAWDAYLTFCRPYDTLLPLLEQEYLRAVRSLSTPDQSKTHGHSPRERLAEHLMSYYWRDKLTINTELLMTFFQSAPDELRGRAISFLGRSLAQNPDSPIEEAILNRLRALWESRVQAARQAEDATAHREELARFGWWFSSRRFTTAWSFEQLRAVLTLVKHIDPEFKVAETLEALAPDHPLECVQLSQLIAIADQEGWEIYGNEQHFKAIIATALASGNAAAKSAADNLIQYFVARGQFGYRSLLQ
jgi:hypothetical protein